MTSYDRLSDAHLLPESASRVFVCEILSITTAVNARDKSSGLSLERVSDLY